uniref:Uncharacterized protein n=1 Tax=Alexandrium monilatum TaxID=311494 RepID=A0A7S4QE17_9DINO
MDFDDLEVCEGGLGPSPQAKRAELLATACPDPMCVEPPPRSRLKLVFMQGGGTIDRCSMPQVQNIFQHSASFSGRTWEGERRGPAILQAKTNWHWPGTPLAPCWTTLPWSGATWSGSSALARGCSSLCRPPSSWLRTRGSVLVGFWAVHGPTVMPPEAPAVMDIEVDRPGQLVDCPVRFLAGEDGKPGPPWRWEVQTLGPFSIGIFKDAKEVPPMVLQEWRERLSSCTD